MKRLSVVGWFVALAVGALSASGCRQGKGERCQVKDDCTPPLICNMATQTCQDTSGGGIDATVPPLIDAPADAIDAP